MKEYFQSEVFPSPIDLIPFIRGKMRTKRLRKKFLNNVDRYSKLVIHDVWEEFNRKRWQALGTACADQIYSVLSDDGWMKKILTTSPIPAPTGGLYILDDDGNPIPALVL